jgi:hypothetical protein
MHGTLLCKRDEPAAAAMMDRPILFSAPMVRALLSGTKTQTRRVAKLAPEASGGLLRPCPYGILGDRLWVRETCRGEELSGGEDGVRYVADGAFRPIEDTKAAAIDWLKLHTYRGHAGTPIGPKVPGIHMPRWASRITLDVTGVRVERLQDISEADAKAEGVEPGQWVVDDPAGLIDWPLKSRERPYANAYALLWDSINGAGAWAANPWVWGITFRSTR